MGFLIFDFRVLIGGVVALLAGCVTKAPPDTSYPGPTVSIQELAGKINENNQGIPTLFARHYLEANINDRGKMRFVNADGDLFVVKPREMLLRGKKLTETIFEIGSTPERYWFTVYEGEGAAQRWGYHRNAAKGCAADVPIRPDLIGEVLGIANVAPNLLEEPAPVMRFNRDLDVYMLVWNTRGEKNWFVEKEVWYDRQTYLPRKVLLYDRNGRIILRANLSQHQEVQGSASGSASASGKRPMIATFYELLFPETRSWMTLRLTEAMIVNQVGNPKPGMIQFKDDPGVPSIQVDKDCE